MKSWTTYLVFTLVIAKVLMFSSLALGEEETVLVEYNGKKVDFIDSTPFLDTDYNRVMIPLRFVSETLGSTVSWDNTNQTVWLNKVGIEVPSSGDLKDLTNVNYENKVIVLMYHHLDLVEKKGVTITPERFESHMRALKDNHFNVISMEQYVDFIHNQKPVPPNAVLITFDDGYESFYTHGFPILQKYGFVATHFIVVKSTDSPSPGMTPHLTWDQMREMKQAGMSFYNHTYDSHSYHNTSSSGKKKPMLANPIYLESEGRVETKQEFRNRIKQDLLLAEQRLDEELGEQINVLAFPYGVYNDTVVEVAKELGIHTFFTVKKGINESGDVLGYRLNGGGPEVTEQMLVSSIHSYGTNKSVPVFAPKRQREIRVHLNGVPVQFRDAKPYLDQNNRVIVPLRAVSEIFGARVQWNGQEKKVEISSHGLPTR